MNLSLTLSAVAAALSAASLSVSVLAYRRGGTRLEVLLSHEVVAGPDDKLQRNYLVRVLNRRPAAVQVAHVQWQMKGGSAIFTVGPVVGDLPQTVDGYHTAEWRGNAVLINAGDSLEAPYSSQLRAVVTLGSGQKSQSRWLELGPADEMVRIAEDTLHAVQTDEPEAKITLQSP